MLRRDSLCRPSLIERLQPPVAERCNHCGILVRRLSNDNWRSQMRSVHTVVRRPSHSDSYTGADPPRCVQSVVPYPAPQRVRGAGAPEPVCSGSRSGHSQQRQLGDPFLRGLLGVATALRGSLGVLHASVGKAEMLTARVSKHRATRWFSGREPAHAMLNIAIWRGESAPPFDPPACRAAAAAAGGRRAPPPEPHRRCAHG